AVIVEDRLGICEELDAAMARHVAGYSDEWRGVLEDPEKLARFASFVNAPDVPDPTITFELERGQPRPASADGEGSEGNGPVPLGAPPLPSAEAAQRVPIPGGSAR